MCGSSRRYCLLASLSGCQRFQALHVVCNFKTSRTKFVCMCLCRCCLPVAAAVLLLFLSFFHVRPLKCMRRKPFPSFGLAQKKCRLSWVNRSGTYGSFALDVLNTCSGCQNRCWCEFWASSLRCCIVVGHVHLCCFLHPLI